MPLQVADVGWILDERFKQRFCVGSVRVSIQTLEIHSCYRTGASLECYIGLLISRNKKGVDPSDLQRGLVSAGKSYLRSKPSIWFEVYSASRRGGSSL